MFCPQLIRILTTKASNRNSWANLSRLPRISSFHGPYLEYLLVQRNGLCAYVPFLASYYSHSPGTQPVMYIDLVSAAPLVQSNANVFPLRRTPPKNLPAA